jgi:hypothetical protein
MRSLHVAPVTSSDAREGLVVEKKNRSKGMCDLDVVRDTLPNEDLRPRTENAGKRG